MPESFYGQPSHPGSSWQLLSSDRVNRVLDQQLQTCRSSGQLLQENDPDHLRHQVVARSDVSGVDGARAAVLRDVSLMLSQCTSFEFQYDPGAP
jgi:hypothetical protein